MPCGYGRSLDVQISWCRDVRATSNVGEAVGVLTSDMYASALVTNLWVAENQHASVCDSGRVGCYCSASRAPWADSDEVAVRPAGRHAVNFTATGRLLPTWGAGAPAASLREGGRMVAAARCGCARGGAAMPRPMVQPGRGQQLTQRYVQLCHSPLGWQSCRHDDTADTGATIVSARAACGSTNASTCHHRFPKCR